MICARITRADGSPVDVLARVEPADPAVGERGGVVLEDAVGPGGVPVRLTAAEERRAVAAAVAAIAEAAEDADVAAWEAAGAPARRPGRFRWSP